jgi:hypothetical protein
MMTRCFISSPPIIGTDEETALQASSLLYQLLDCGIAPFFQHLIVKDQDWSQAKFAWLLASDCVLRLPGKCKLSDEECLFAVNNDIPIYKSVRAIIREERTRFGLNEDE